MKFDRTRNSAELRELLDYLVCIAVGGTVAGTIGMSWVVASLIVLYVFRRWKKDRGTLSGSFRVLAIVTCIALLLSENWSSYCEGVSAGFNAASAMGQKAANKPPRATPGPRTSVSDLNVKRGKGR